jgi:hypothetical protein
MLTRRDVLTQLKISGLRGLSALKQNCRQYENYMAAYYDFEIVKTPGARKNSYNLLRSLYSQRNGNPNRYVRVRLMAQSRQVGPRMARGRR